MVPGRGHTGPRDGPLSSSAAAEGTGWGAAVRALGCAGSMVPAHSPRPCWGNADPTQPTLSQTLHLARLGGRGCWEGRGPGRASAVGSPIFPKFLLLLSAPFQDRVKAWGPRPWSLTSRAGTAVWKGFGKGQKPLCPLAGWWEGAPGPQRPEDCISFLQSTREGHGTTHRRLECLK